MGGMRHSERSARVTRTERVVFFNRAAACLLLPCASAPQLRHLLRMPPLAVVLPTLKLGAVLGARNVISFGAASASRCAALPATQQA
jgi:hypothetical protein